MIAMSSNWRDVQKYFENSYIKIQGYGDKLFFVNRVRENMIVGVDENDTLFELYLSNKEPFELDYVLPHRAVFQHGDEALFLRRNPSRQYRRGLHADNTAVVYIATGTNCDLNFYILKSYVEKQKYMSFMEAVDHKGSMRSMALSPRMSYIRAGGEIRMDMTTIAVVNHEKKTIRIKRPIFKPEILQFLKNGDGSYGVSP